MNKENKEEIDLLSIKKSTDHSIFIFTKLNRAIDYAKVQRFVEESKKSPYLMATCPILVNSKMEIIDGQHRYLACKENNIPIFYIQSDKLTYDDIIVLNKDQKNWNLEDYISHHVTKGNINFIKLLVFSKKTGLSISLCCLFLGFNRKSLVYSIKNGSLIFPNEEREEKILKKCNHLIDFKKSISSQYGNDFRVKHFFSYSFSESISALDLDIDFEYFFEKLLNRYLEVEPVRAIQDYHRQFSILGLI
jgi:hypothetical protein